MFKLSISQCLYLGIGGFFVAISIGIATHTVIGFCLTIAVFCGILGKYS